MGRLHKQRQREGVSRGSEQHDTEEKRKSIDQIHGSRSQYKLLRWPGHLGFSLPKPAKNTSSRFTCESMASDLIATPNLSHSWSLILLLFFFSSLYIHDLEQWLSSLSIPQNHQGDLLKHRMLRPTQSFWFSSSGMGSENLHF